MDFPQVQLYFNAKKYILQLDTGCICFIFNLQLNLRLFFSDGRIQAILQGVLLAGNS